MDLPVLGIGERVGITPLGGFIFGESELKVITQRIKELADRGSLSEEQIDQVLRAWATA